jgi:hypothetical protein
MKRGPYSSYAPSTVSQDFMTQEAQSLRDDASSIAGSSVSYSQADRLERRLSGSLSVVSDYKSQDLRDDDARTEYSAASTMTDY